MYSSDARLAQILMRRNIEEAERLARSYHLVHSIEKDLPGWRRFVGQCGAWLITMGERLEKHAPAQASH